MFSFKSKLPVLLLLFVISNKVSHAQITSAQPTELLNLLRNNIA